MAFRVIVHASEILTGAGIRQKDGRRSQEEDLGRIPDGALVYSVKKKKGGREIPDRIEWVGPTPRFQKSGQELEKPI